MTSWGVNFQTTKLFSKYFQSTFALSGENYVTLLSIINWALHNKVKEVMVLDGIAVEGLPDPKRTPIILSSDGRQADAANLIRENENNIDLKNKNQEIGDDISVYPTSAFVGGMVGGILSSCLSNGIASKAVLVYSPSGIPDPDGAAILIESVSKITENESLKIDTQKLREQGASIRTRMEKIIQSYVGQQQEGQQGQGQAPKSTKEGIMYG